MKQIQACILLIFMLLPACGNSPSGPPARIFGLRQSVLVPGGVFTMGDPDSRFSDEKPARAVKILDFYMDETPITWGDYEKFVQAGGPKPAHYPNRIYNKADRPATGMSWYEAVRYCNWRSEIEGLQPAYFAAGRRDEYGFLIWERKREAEGYRLPTEAEYEYVAKAGAENRPFVSGKTFEASKVNYDTIKGLSVNKERLRGVKDLPANPFGLYDLSGNVREWCDDFYSPETYASNQFRAPAGPAKGRTKVLRGGSWGTPATDFLRTSKRCYSRPDNYNFDIGFRCVRPAVNIPSGGKIALKTVSRLSPEPEPQAKILARADNLPDFRSKEFQEKLSRYIAENYSYSIYFQIVVDDQPVINPQKMAEMIIDISLENGINPMLLTGIIAAESGFGACSYPRWFNNPMAYHWQNSLMEAGPPVYEDLPQKRNRKFKNLREGFTAFCVGIRKDWYRKAAAGDFYEWHKVYVGYEADEWMHVVSRVFRDLGGLLLEPKNPAQNIGSILYLNGKYAQKTARPEEKPAKTSVYNDFKASNGHFYLICGNFDRKENAENFVAKLQNAGFSDAEIQLSGKKYRVLGGVFKEDSAARNRLNALAEQSFAAWVLKK